MKRLRANRDALVAALCGLAALVFGARDAGYLGGGPAVIAPQGRVAAITADLRDVDIVQRPDGSGRVIRATDSGGGHDQPAAPLMDWEDRNVREGRTQVWCLRAADAEAQGVFRQVLTDLATRFAPQGRSGIAWRESCRGATYSLTDRAAEQCGIGDGAVACAGPASYCGRTALGDAWCGGEVSYNRGYRLYTTSGGRQGTAPGLDTAGLRLALSHEVSHLLLNLGHNNCGTVIDPASGRAVPSAMSALYLPSGPSCTRPPATGLTEADWLLSLGYYDFGPAPAATVTPSATPAPTATVPPVVQEPPGLGATAHPQRAVRTGTSGGRAAAVFTAYRLDVVGAIADEADRLGLPPLWVLAMGAQEGSLACPPSCPVGDLDLNPQGSIGTFQIYCSVHPSPTGDCRYWEDPVNAMREMASRWRWAYGLCNGAFLDDPHGCLIVSVPQAQGSIGWTQAIASAAFRVALIAYVDLLQSRGASVPPELAGALNVAAQGLDDIALRAAVQAEQLRQTAGR